MSKEKLSAKESILKGTKEIKELSARVDKDVKKKPYKYIGIAAAFGAIGVGIAKYMFDKKKEKK